jgi:hypothetical protein
MDIEEILKSIDAQSAQYVPLPRFSDERTYLVPEYEEAQLLNLDVRGSGIEVSTMRGPATLWRTKYRADYLVHGVKTIERQGTHHILEMKDGHFSDFLTSPLLEPMYDFLDCELKERENRSFA